MKRVLLVALGLGFSATAAWADQPAPVAPSAPLTFTAPVGLDGLVWAVSETCAQGDDLAQRRCRVVRDQALARWRSGTFVVAGDQPLELGAYSATTRSALLTVRACIHCRARADGWYAIGAGAVPTFDGAAAVAVELLETTRPFASAAAADAWRTEVLPRLRSELVVSVPDSPVWSREGRTGLALKVTGFRVYDACDGSLVAATPGAPVATPVPGTCAAPGPVVDDDAGRVDRLSRPQIMAALAPVIDASRACAEKGGRPGDAKLRFVIDRDGAVVELSQEGDFVGSDVGACIDAAGRAARFPRSRQARTTFNYPLALR